MLTLKSCAFVAGDNHSLFSLEINHGGVFVQSSVLRYEKGNVTFVDNVDIDEFSLIELSEMLKEIGYRSPEPVYFHFRLPLIDLNKGLVPLSCDADVMVLGRYVKLTDVIGVYVEHGNSTLNNYGRSPLKDFMNLDESPASPEYNREMTKFCPNSEAKKKLTFDLNVPSNGIDENTRKDSSSKELVLYKPKVRQVQMQNKVDKGNNCVSSADQNNIFDLPPVQVIDLDIDDEIQRYVGVNPRQGRVITEIIGGTNVDEIYEMGFTEEGLQWSLTNDYAFNLEADCEREWTDAVQKKLTDAKKANESIGDLSEDEGSRGSEFRFARQETDAFEEIDVVVGPYQGVLDPPLENEENDVVVLDTDAFTSHEIPTNARETLLKNLKKPVTCSAGEVHEADFRLGETFTSREVVKEAIHNLSLQTRRQLKIMKNDLDRMRANCRGIVPGMNDHLIGIKENRKGRKVTMAEIFCPWVLYVTWSTEEEVWMVKTYDPTHTCIQTREVKSCTQGYIATKIASQIAGNPNIPVSSLKRELQSKYKIDLPFMKVYRAKQLALNKLRGDYEKQYGMLRDYGLELQLRNPGTTVKIAVESEPNYDIQTRVFKRIYICLGPLKDGFKYAQRELIGLDGAFMKGPYPGQVLSAVSIDGNNGIYPVAYAIVETENKNSWTWFLKCLGEDLDIGSNTNFTFISDRQKVSDTYLSNFL